MKVVLIPAVVPNFPDLSVAELPKIGNTSSTDSRFTVRWCNEVVEARYTGVSVTVLVGQLGDMAAVMRFKVLHLRVAGAAAASGLSLPRWSGHTLSRRS